MKSHLLLIAVPPWSTWSDSWSTGSSPTCLTFPLFYILCLSSFLAVCADVAGWVGLPHYTLYNTFPLSWSSFYWSWYVVYSYLSSRMFLLPVGWLRVMFVCVKILWWKGWVVVFWWFIESFGRHWWKALGWHSGFWSRFLFLFLFWNWSFDFSFALVFLFLIF